jgi:hypothetical protein
MNGVRTCLGLEDVAARAHAVQAQHSDLLWLVRHACCSAARCLGARGSFSNFSNGCGAASPTLDRKLLEVIVQTRNKRDEEKALGFISKAKEIP